MKHLPTNVIGACNTIVQRFGTAAEGRTTLLPSTDGLHA
jgi:hypothetical protein